jgi:hypothetical protein
MYTAADSHEKFGTPTQKPGSDKLLVKADAFTTTQQPGLHALSALLFTKPLLCVAYFPGCCTSVQSPDPSPSCGALLLSYQL